MTEPDIDTIRRELHDSVLQDLFAAGMSLSRFAKPDGPAASREQISEALQLISGAADDIRSLLGDGGTSAPVELSTPLSGLRTVCSSWQNVSGMTVTCSVNVDDALPSDVAHDVEMIVREAVSNAVRHSGGTTVSVAVFSAGDRLFVEVGDDGSGIPDQVCQGNGLVNMSERAARHGGSLWWCAEPDGTFLQASIPLGVRTSDV